MENKYEHQLNLRHIESYRKYLNLIKIYYDNNNICPTNKKLELNKKYENNKIEIKCDDDKFNFEIKLPKYHNIYLELRKLRSSRDTCLTNIKNNVTYKKDIESFKKNKELYIRNIKNIEKYNKILNEDDKFIIKLDKQIIDLKDKLNKIYIDRTNYFSNLDKIDVNTKKKIIQIFSEKYPLKDNEIEKYRKSLNITFNNLKYWLLWLSKVKEYVITIKTYNKKNEHYKYLLETIAQKNNNWMYIDPVIINKSKESKINKLLTNKYSNSKDIKDIKQKTSGDKKIKIKIK